MTDFGYLPGDIARAAVDIGDRLTAVRLRPQRPVQLVYPGGDMLCGMLDRDSFEGAVMQLMGHSLYARQYELDEAYFTLPDGSRAGVCGRFPANGPRNMQDISSVNIRIAREVPGCADGIIADVVQSRGMLIISPPGMGKTTLLRDIARQLSENGHTVCIIDERAEIAACTGGIPRLDVGPRTDVITGCPKQRAVMLAIRSCAPDVLITDEVGSSGDCAALDEALRCGVRVIASAHGYSLEPFGQRATVRDMLGAGMFEMGVLLGSVPGCITGRRYFTEKGSGGLE